jgi:hypothetical protein
MADTKSKSRNKGKDAQQEKARPVETESAALASETKRTSKTMADNEPSIIEFSEDISKAEAPTPLPKGDYPAEIRAATRKTSQAGNPYAQVLFFISPESYPADFTEGDPDGQTLGFNRVSLQDTPASRHRLRKFGEAIGAPLGKTLDLNDWVGRTATVTIDHDTYEGETRAQITKVTAA